MTALMLPPLEFSETVEWTRPNWLQLATPAPTVEALTPTFVAADVRLDLVSVDESGRIVASLPVRLDRRVESENGVVSVLSGEAAGGVMRVTVTANSETTMINTTLQVHSTGGSPADVFEATRFARTFLPGRRIGYARDGQLIGTPTPVPSTPLEIPFEIVDTARALAFIQSITSVEQGFPDELTVGEARMIGEMETLLRGGTVTSKWSALVTEAEEPLLSMITEGPVGFEFTTRVIRELEGQLYDLGDGIHEIRAQLDPDAEVAEGFIRVVPAFDNDLKVRLVNPAPKRLSDPYKPFVRVDQALLDAAAQ